MPAITVPEAVERLTTELEKLPVPELLEIHDSLFGKKTYDEESAFKDPRPLVEKLVKYVRGNRELDEIIDLWGLILLDGHDMWYDDEDDKLHFNETDDDW